MQSGFLPDLLSTSPTTWYDFDFKKYWSISEENSLKHLHFLHYFFHIYFHNYHEHA